ncbi:MAG: ribonuclease R [Candidatus Taylorbacteria bacterium RIFCSPHIGHO2_02_49_25]|uniref:Ribonuclease R n=1 Tax=Candidatus Taylorbacteria bacterium RIFCSPHIGHO2_02_49_25 TaxID=1802305 RepID=A0A1G2ME93_9BACT|nr:MAG: Ribonuclease R [Parcubacteria group bacterium GW2011_GWF2_50_9]OHA19060.1 MAG: ribonuclease R [Candidatus Taylorbacteria bacterium RIFCSPHIGHO2_01_FULL_49_60]OHA22230.1 MAG: ribonuclease R [Candidatus Taylorbacteria bacterium RIFCSPHIGHO2_02_49_25]OHA36104.1 MAG: ribonuclease R [Candidatus Taylorbacteria bacterium RIFCSPLOWO2_02_50_13]OHA40952.1 MAG: ribonuclease R [Candidatus Taylorbacteria bacterium RIFCSPLOWO2_02_FULL_50_120]OHA46284.1 MAG: ribonuclease R [Candidatus Taylorbacteria 
MKNKKAKKKGEKKHFIAAIRGVLSVNSRAIGFISPERILGKKVQAGKGEKLGEDVMIETPNLNTALNRDDVEVEMLKGKVRGRRVGRVVKIIRRNKMRFVGTIEERGTRLFLIPDDFRMYAPIGIPKPPRDAQKGYKALAEIREWKIGEEPAGEILKVIGEKGEHETEMESIILERGFKSDFPRGVEIEAKRIIEEATRLIKEIGSPILPNEIRKRRDFRATTLFTIDPANAKDFDDALSFRRLSDSEVKDKGLKVKDSIYEIGIHIADVSHYVKEDSALDCEARERGTSVYLVDRTIPMLPHALSNDLCSLNPKVDRLAFSAVFEMDGEGRVLGRWFGKSVIHSQKRFTYESAQEAIDGASARFNLAPTERLNRADFGEELCTLNSIAKKLRAEKTRQGAIDFEQDEVGFELDESGRPVRIFKKKRLDAHKLIEEFMLLANREVARFFYEAASKSGGKLRFIYRIHDVPDREKLDQLRVFVRALGHELPMQKDGGVRGKDLQALFTAIEGHASESLIKTAAIRSMAKAIYSTANIGHFGLAFEYYTHFTSPIRRYPDLLVHRSLFSILERHKFDPQKLAELERMATNATQKEIAAAEAERESIKLKQVEYMKERIGREFEGIISGVTEWGIYVEERETRTEGMVKLRDLKDDYYVLRERSYAVVGERTKKKYALGDSVRFKVVGADIERKTLDYRLV